VYDPPMTFTILSGRWVGNTGCPANSTTKVGRPNNGYSKYKGKSTNANEGMFVLFIFAIFQCRQHHF
jgi:hypothetical protein